MIQLDELKYEIVKAELAVQRFVNDHEEQLKDEIRTQYHLSSDIPIKIHCLHGYVSAYFNDDRFRNVYYTGGSWLL